MKHAENRLRPERIVELSERLGMLAESKIGEIEYVNRAAKMLAINAQIEAARAGAAGAGFAIVAQEFKGISADIDQVTEALANEVKHDLDELRSVGAAIVEHMRGQRLADLALNVIDIIDRNLFERTCDVRWWATDSAIVACLEGNDPQAARHASDRLKVILDAYTVYLDLWICDTRGRVVATARPERYRAVPGSSVADCDWFRQAMKSRSGDDFSVADIDCPAVLDGAPVATYAAAVREGGRKDGRAIGVLGIHFDWQPQAQAVLDGVRLTPEERDRTCVMILDQNHRLLATSDGRDILTNAFELEISGGAMGSYAQRDITIGYALTPGYETYAGLGWYGCIAQKIEGEWAPLAKPHLALVRTG